MICRLANYSRDALSILEGAQDFISRTPFIHLMPDNEQDLLNVLGRILTLENVEVMVVEHKRKVVAGLGFLFTPYHWNPKVLVADELFWWASKDAPFGAAYKLIYWSLNRVKDKGAIPIFHMLSTSPKGVDRIYRRLGLNPSETAYV